MIKFETIDIIINNRNLKRLKNYKEDIKIGDTVNIPISLLDKGSHVFIVCICDICGLEKKIMYQKYIKNISNGGYYSCSSKCSQNKVKKTSNERYGQDYYMKTTDFINRISETNLHRYGNKSYLSSDIGKSKISEIMINKYGNSNPFSCIEIIDTIKKNSIKKYGVDNVSKSTQIKEKIGKKNRENWEKKFKEYYEKHNLNIIGYCDNIYKIQCDNCKSIFDINRLLLSNRLLLKTKICTKCNPSDSSNRSGYELELYEFIRENYDYQIETNKKDAIKYELDIFLPDKKLAFEFNGLYWHSDKYKEPDYHYNKHKLCKNNDIELIQIWEDDWLYKRDIIKSIILNKLGKNIKNRIFARKCAVKLVSSNIANTFLNENHLQGYCKSKINIGLFYNEELVSIMTFGKLRRSLGSKDISDKYELHRFCSKLNYSIVGGSSKLLNYFKFNFKYDNIISYYDKSFGYNSFYEKIGFKFDGETKINYHYIKGNIRIHRYNLRKDKLVKMGYDINMTEQEITKRIGLLRIYGVGNYRYLI